MGLFTKKEDLLAKAIALRDRGELDAAASVLEAAIAAEPGAAAPRAHLANVVAFQLMMQPGDQAMARYARARHFALEALALDDSEPLALAVFGRLARMRQRPSRASSPQARRAIAEGDVLFGQHQYDRAGQAYARAMQADPELAEPVKLVGNCHFALKQYAPAEQGFLRAIELDPQDAQAHHFLADTYGAQSQYGRALVTARNAIAANPAYFPAWQVVRKFHEARGRPLRPFRIRPLAVQVTRGADGKPRVSAPSGASGAQEVAAWLTYAIIKHQLMGDDGAEPGDPVVETDVSAALAAELRGLRAAAAVIGAGSDPVPDAVAVLRELLAIDRAGDLPTAILLLAYDEAYRDDLEALKRRRPNVCADFLERYALRPF